MPLTVRNSARRRRKNPDEKLPERPGESATAQVMAPTRMKLRVRRRDTGAAGGGGQQVEEEERSRESGGGRSSSRRKNTSNTSTTAAAAAASSSSPPTSSASASARAVMAAEEASPDSKCPICLDRFNNLAYLDRCLHRFCFPCIQEWSHNKAECPLCKQPFASILHSVRAEDDFKEYTLRPAPANSSVAATVAMVAAMASAARRDHQMRLMLRRHRAADGGETTTRRRRRERGGRGGGSRRAGERAGVWEWYLDSPPLPPLPHQPAVSPVVAEDSGEGEDLEQQRMRGGAELAERGVIFEGLTGLGGAVAPVTPNDRASRRLMTRLAARQRLQREGGTVRRLRERETVAFRRALYRCGIRVRGVAGVSGNQGQQQRDITAESFRRNPAHLNRLRPWLRRELTVLYGAHGTLVDIVQRIIMARLARHGLEDTPTIEEELRPFLLARTDHFLHELVSFARSPLSLENYDLQAVYEPPAAALELDGTSSPSDSSSVIAISEGEEEGSRAEEAPQGRAGGAHDDVIQAGSCLSLSAWDDETPGPSYSTAEPSCSLASLSFSPAPQEAANEEEAGEKREEAAAAAAEEEEGEDECLIVGYKKPIAERTPELVQLSSDTEEEEVKEKEEEKAERLPPLSSSTPPLSCLPTIPPSTSGAYREEQEDKPKERDEEAGGRRSRARSWSGSSARSRESVCTLSPSERRRESSEAAKEKRRRKRRRRGRERSGTLYNPNRSIYPAMMHRRSHSPSPFHSSVESGSPLPPSPPDSSWEYHCSPLSSSVSAPSRSSSSSSPPCSSPQPSSPRPPRTPPTPSLSSGDAHHRDKPGGKRKYKSRHLDSDDKDPTWRPSNSHRREKRRERGEKERRRRRERRRDAHRESGSYCGESSSSRRRRDERSPSVEIIYEGTVACDATQPPARKRRRKRHRRTQHSSSPVIITLDSDSSRDGRNKRGSSGSSSPLSSQQTVDFSDLPPLPLVHSAGVGGALDAEIGELPVDILDRGSDGSETEPVGPSARAGPIDVDNSNSDRDVDVENVESSSPLGCDGEKGPIRGAGAGAAGGDGVAPKTRNSEVSSSDSHLLATILNDLKGIAAPKCGLPLTFDPSRSPDTRKRRLQDPCEAGRARSEQGGWFAETGVRDQHQGLQLAPCRSSTPPPPLQQLKERRAREEGTDVPPLLKQASPVRTHNRNTPPPLKHKDAGSPHPSPASPADLHPPAAAAACRLAAELPRHAQAIPPISTLKTHFTGALALRGGLASTSSRPAADVRPPCFTADSHEPRALTLGPPAGAGHASPPVGRPPLLDFLNSFHPKSHSSHGRTTGTSPPLSLHPVNSSSPLDSRSAGGGGWSPQEPARTDSTSGGGRNKTLADLHLSAGVSAAAAGCGVFSGVDSTDASPAVLVSSPDPGTRSPSPPDRETLSQRLRVHAHPPPAAAAAAAAALRPSSAASEELTDGKSSSVANHEGRSPRGHLPTIDVHCSSPAPPADEHAATDGHLNHAALPSPTRLAPHESKLHPDPKHRNHFAPDAQRDFLLHTDNHLTSSPPSARTQWKSRSPPAPPADSQAPAGERSAGGVWTTHTHSAT